MIEIIDLLNPTSKYAFEERRAQKYLITPYFGGVLQNKPFLYGSRGCLWTEKMSWGGVYSKRVIPNLKDLNRKNKKFSLQILVDSYDNVLESCGVVLNDSTFWCTGLAIEPEHDYYGTDDYKNTEFISLGPEIIEDFEAEFDEDSEISEDDCSEEFFKKRLRQSSEGHKQLYISRPGPKLPKTISNHAIIKINSKTIYFIGGYDYDTYRFHKGTWIIDPSNNFKMKQGPNLLYDRPYRPACAKMELNGKVYIIVAGGMFKLGMNKAPKSEKLVFDDTVEILDTSSPDEGWIQGMYLSNNTPNNFRVYA